MHETELGQMLKSLQELQSDMGDVKRELRLARSDILKLKKAQSRMDGNVTRLDDEIANVGNRLERIEKLFL